MMKNRVLSLILSSIVAISLLSGCGSSPTSEDTKQTVEADTSQTSSGTTQNDESSSSTDSAQAIIDERKAQAEETGEYQKVIFAFFTWTGRPAGADRIQEKISEYTREKLGLDVELLILDSAAYAQNVRLMLSSGEQLDIFNSNSLGYTTVVNDGYCLDLEEDGLLQTYGSGILDTINPDYIEACRISGQLYGLPQMRDMALGAGTIVIGQEYLDGIGYDYASKEVNDVIHTDWDEIDEIFAQLHEAYPDKYVFAPADNLVTQGSTIDNIGGDNFGVLLDTVNSLTVENLFTSEEFLEKCQRMYDWNQKGYISKDAMTDDTAISAKIKSGSYMAMLTQGKPGYKRQISGECGRPMVLFQLEGDILKSSAITSMLWHINQACEDPIAAMQVLNAFYTDPYLSNLLMWGEENVDYVVTEDGHITFPEGIDANNAEYYHTMNWLLPNQFIAHIWEGDPLDLWEQTETFNENAATSKALGFSFDNSSYSSEYTALSNIYDEYSKQLTYGFIEPATGLAEMVEKMESAGLDDYIAAKQAALDEWASEKGLE